jgi:hypothetical protein
MKPTGSAMPLRNPFHDPLVTELLEDPRLYRKMFSHSVLVGEALQVFQPTNTVLLGPQGTGKSMILNLLRYSVLNEWLSDGNLPDPLGSVSPFLGISINLQRANFIAFGRRSVQPHRAHDERFALDASAAADFINHYLYREFLKGIDFIYGPEGGFLRNWMNISGDPSTADYIAAEIARCTSWFGWYAKTRTLAEAIARCEERLLIWRSFLNMNIDEIPVEVWESKSGVGEPLHEMANILRHAAKAGQGLPLFVTIDQYEVLPELNRVFGSTLQRIVNTLIKARDPVVFFKIGARTYDWGKELRVWGAESRVEVQRDYRQVDINEILMRTEDGNWRFHNLAKDVAFRRINQVGRTKVSVEQVPHIFGKGDPHAESFLYFSAKTWESRKTVLLKKLRPSIQEALLARCPPSASPLTLRLAAAWALQRQQRGLPEEQIIKEAADAPWENSSWAKERVEIALLQVASLANQKKRYSGWATVLQLSGSNITAFLYLCSEIWDIALKLGYVPSHRKPLPVNVQTEGILTASTKWRSRDRIEIATGGRERYEVLSRLGPSIHEALVTDFAISNPGFSGFSLRDTDLIVTKHGKDVARFLQNAVSWAIFEERLHTSKQREGATRRKYFLHPLLSPAFEIPFTRVKEPYYASVDEVFAWLFNNSRTLFRKKRVGKVPPQLDLSLDQDEPR